MLRRGWFLLTAVALCGLTVACSSTTASKPPRGVPSSTAQSTLPPLPVVGSVLAPVSGTGTTTKPFHLRLTAASIAYLSCTGPGPVTLATALNSTQIACDSAAASLDLQVEGARYPATADLSVSAPSTTRWQLTVDVSH